MQTLLRCMHTLAGYTWEKYWTFRSWKWHAVVSRSISKLILQMLSNVSDTQWCGILHLVKNSSPNVSPCETSWPFFWTWDDLSRDIFCGWHNAKRAHSNNFKFNKSAIWHVIDDFEEKTAPKLPFRREKD